MSLVNNMLRDLDQRRKESDNSSNAVKLMPAREFVEDSKKNPLAYALAGLFFVAIALIFYWMQLNQSDTQQLDIRVQPLSSAEKDEPDRLIQELEASIVAAESAATEQLNIDELSFEESENVSIRASRQEEIDNEQTVTLPPTVNPISLESVQLEQSTLVADSRQREAIMEAAKPAAVADSNLVRNGVGESIKEAPEFTNEQLDTIAVQDALRLISNGRTEEAYTTLEQYIAENRYAHQSRETYAKLLMSQDRAEEANALIDVGLNLAPNHAGFKKVKARLLIGAGQIAEAVDVLISRAPDVSDDAEYHDLLASAQLSSRDYAGAIISYSGLVQYDGSQGKWWYGFAAAHDQLGNVALARQAYSRAMQYSNLSANLRRRSQERLGALNL
jgi:Tfp pilus assembly protein PilF